MEQKPSAARIALKWGVICALASIILSTVINMTGLWKSSGVSMLAFLPLVVFLIMSMKEFREANGAFMTYSEGLSVGMLTAGVSALITSAWGMVYTKLIDPTFMTQVRDNQMEKMEEQGLSQDKIDAGMEMYDKFSGGGLTFIFGLIFTLIMAFIMVLIISAILKKNKPVF